MDAGAKTEQITCAKPAVRGVTSDVTPAAPEAASFAFEALMGTGEDANQSRTFATWPSPEATRFTRPGAFGFAIQTYGAHLVTWTFPKCVYFVTSHGNSYNCLKCAYLIGIC